MKALMPLVTLLVFAPPVSGSTSKLLGHVSYDMGDPGVPDDFLRSLGRRKAVDFLIARLKEDKFAASHLGVLNRLSHLINKENEAAILRAIGKYIERQARSNADIGKGVDNVCVALRIVGGLGGQKGAEYLREWVAGDHQMRRVRSRGLSAANPGAARSMYYACAISGLSLNPAEAAKAVLSVARRTPPAGISMEDAVKQVDFAISIHERVRKEGQENVVPPTINMMEGIGP